MNLVENSAKSLILSYIELLQKNNYKLSPVKKNQYNFDVTVELGKDKIKLQVYFGKKGTKTVLQGNKELREYTAIDALLFGKQLFENSSFEIEEPQAYIGTDESGKGDYFGPLVVAGVYVDSESSAKLKKIGVRDSKELSERAIIKLASEIKHIIGNNFKIISLTPSKYNSMYAQIGNVNKLLGWTHANIIESLATRCNAKEVICDKFGNESYIIDSLQPEKLGILLHQFTRAERYTAVAAASILAREKFCNWFEESKKLLNIDLPKGASEQVEKTSFNIKLKFGEDKLSELVKLHFKTTNKIISNK